MAWNIDDERSEPGGWTEERLAQLIADHRRPPGRQGAVPSESDYTVATKILTRAAPPVEGEPVAVVDVLDVLSGSDAGGDPTLWTIEVRWRDGNLGAAMDAGTVALVPLVRTPTEPEQ